MKSSLDIQVGGDHYKKLPYQPVALAVKIKLNFIQGNIVKYVSRYHLKNGKQDLEKVMHYAQLGCDLDPLNLVSITAHEEVEKFVKENSLSSKVCDLIMAACWQNWTKVITIVSDLIKEEYETVS